MPARALGTACSAVVLLAPAAIADVLVVAADGSTQHAQIATAVGLAVDGDVVLVRSGTYAPFTITAKSLTVTADTGADVMIAGTTTVRDLGATQTVVLSGLRGTGITSASTGDELGVGLVLRDNAGAVRVQSCRFEGARGYGDGLWGTDCWLPNHTGGWDGIRVSACSGGTVIRRTIAVGGRGREAPLQCYEPVATHAPGGDGIRVSGSTVAVYETTATGGRGERNGFQGGDGGAGLRFVASGGGFLSGSTFSGGQGGDGTDWLISFGGVGGDGTVVAAGSMAQFLACAHFGAPGGTACTGTTPPGPSGQGLVANGAVFEFAVEKLTVEAPAVLRAGVPLRLDVRGTPGALAYAFLADATVFEPRPSWRGVLCAWTGTPRQSRVLGTIPASGHLVADVALPALPALLVERALHVQVARTDGSVGHVLGEPAVVTRLGAGL